MEDSVNFYYEFKLMQCFREVADNQFNIIQNQQDWNTLMGSLILKKLATVKDTQTLDRYKPCFPLDFETFLKTVQQAFGDKSIKSLEKNIDDSREQLENCRTLVNMMNLKLLSKDELFNLSNIVYTCHKSSMGAESSLKQIERAIQPLSEDVFGFVWDKIYRSYDLLGDIKLPHTYIRQEKAALEKEFQFKRVRQVHYRNKEIKVLKVYESGIIKELAYCADKDFPVENYKIPREFPHYEQLTHFFSQIGATKELLFSKYLPSYLGFDDLTDPRYNQYFFEIKKGKALKLLLQEQQQTLIGFDSLFKYWAKELLYAFRDLTYRCTYALHKPVTLKNVYVSDVGIKIYLKKVKFQAPRDDNLDFHLQMESKFLQMYAQLLVEMLTGKEGPADFDHLNLEPELKCILYECMHAQEKTDKRETTRYDAEIAKFLQKEVEKEAKENDMSVAELQLQNESAHLGITVGEDKENAPASKSTRKVKRKQENPKSNKRAGLNEDEDGKIPLSQEISQFKETTGESKKQLGLLEFSEQMGGELKKQKQERYLTIQGLLNHPYFMSINESDISAIIDQFEQLSTSEQF